jgi:hypothetical protein
VLSEIFNAHAEGNFIPPQNINSALRAAGAYEFNAEEVLRCNPSALDFNDFKRAALSPSPLEMWAGSIPLASILADALPMSSGQDPLQRISMLGAEEIACIAEGVGAALKHVLASKVESLRKAYEKLGAQENQTLASKFQVLLSGIMMSTCVSHFHSPSPNLPSSDCPCPQACSSISSSSLSI